MIRFNIPAPASPRLSCLLYGQFAKLRDGLQRTGDLDLDALRLFFWEVIFISDSWHEGHWYNSRPSGPLVLQSYKFMPKGVN